MFARRYTSQQRMEATIMHHFMSTLAELCVSTHASLAQPVTGIVPKALPPQPGGPGVANPPRPVFKEPPPRQQQQPQQAQPLAARQHAQPAASGHADAQQQAQPTADAAGQPPPAQQPAIPTPATPLISVANRSSSLQFGSVFHAFMCCASGVPLRGCVPKSHISRCM